MIIGMFTQTKYGKIGKLCYMDMGRFIVHVKSEDIYGDLTGYVKKRLETSNYKVKRPLPIGKKEEHWVDEG